MNDNINTIAIIVAHPDDETLWAGGTIIQNPEKEYFIASLCRKKDADRAPKFERILNTYGANGIMGDLDDGPDQIPLVETDVENAIMELLPGNHFDLVITHNIYGEYTRHRRHEEIGRAVINLWHSGKLITNELWAFAYEDGRKAYHPKADTEAPLFYPLPDEVWEQKFNLITQIYGFNKDSWEAQTTPKEEAFWQFINAGQAFSWLAHAPVTI